MELWQVHECLCGGIRITKYSLASWAFLSLSVWRSWGWRISQRDPHIHYTRWSKLSLWIWNIRATVLENSLLLRQTPWRLELFPETLKRTNSNERLVVKVDAVAHIISYLRTDNILYSYTKQLLSFLQIRSHIRLICEMTNAIRTCWILILISSTKHMSNELHKKASQNNVSKLTCSSFPFSLLAYIHCWLKKLWTYSTNETDGYSSHKVL